MHETMDAVWWITAVELPVFSGLFWLIQRQHGDGERALEELRERVEAAQSQLRETLGAHRLEVAKSYVTFGALKDVEQRLTDHLLRIEAKLALGWNFLSDGDGR